MSTDDAFAEAYRAHYWAVSRFVARRLDGQAHEVEEVVAEVFSIAWRRRAELPDAPLPWLYGVARNCLANTVRGWAATGGCCTGSATTRRRSGGRPWTVRTQSGPAPGCTTRWPGSPPPTRRCCG